MRCPRLVKPVLVLMVVVSFLAGCRLGPERQMEVAATVHQIRDRSLSCPQQRTDRCAAASSLYQLAGEPGHRVALLENGENALLARLQAIRSARRSIELQTYIFVPDDLGALVLQELLLAARRGVRVRLLMDQLSALSDSSLLAQLAVAHQNLEIKVYNPTFGKAESSLLDLAGSAFCCFRQLNHRMHNKAFVVDDRIGITGGRNYQNRYFGWDPEFNFLDRDVLLLGREALAMRESFDAYWRHPNARHAEYLLDVSAHILNGETDIVFDLDDRPHIEHIRRLLADGRALTDRLGERLRQVGQVAYLSDHPDKLIGHDEAQAQDLTLKIRELLAEAHSSVVLQTPYLLFTRRATRLFRRLRKDHPDIDMVVSTNSLASTDSFPVYAISRKRRKTYLKSLGLALYEMKPQPAAMAYWIPPQWRASQSGPEMRDDFPLVNPGERLSLHSKTLVLDSHITVIGSHNYDPRSEDYNSESSLVIWDDATAAEAMAQIYLATTPDNAWRVARAPQVPVISFFSGIIGSISRKLPVLDIWPFRYGTCYELKPGFDPVAPDHPAFHARYEDVGEFPKVSAPLKQIQTELISAFGGFAKPVL